VAAACGAEVARYTASRSADSSYQVPVAHASEQLAKTAGRRTDVL